MTLVIADTIPINYLLLIGHIDLLPVLFNKVVLPSIVETELSHPKTPPVVREWIAHPPAWVEIRQTSPYASDVGLALLDAGEKDAIALALKLRADRRLCGRFSSSRTIKAGVLAGANARNRERA